MSPNQLDATQPLPGQQICWQNEYDANKTPSSRGWYITKIGLGAVSLMICITLVGMASTLVCPNLGQMEISMQSIIPTASFAAVCQIAEFITLWVRRNRGLEPGAHVAMHLLAWLAGGTCSGLFTRYVVPSTYDVAFWHSYDTEACVILALLYLLTTRILHFTLFVRACVETSRQNNQTRTLVIIVPGHQPGSVYVVASGKVPQPYAAQLQHGGSTEVSDRVVELPRAHATIQ